MRRPLVRTVLVASLGIALLGLASLGARAGGGSFDSMDDSDDDSGPPYVGNVKDRDGNAIADAKVTIKVAAFNSSLILRTDDQGHFNVKGFDKSVDPDGVDFSCSADGFKFFARTKAKTGDGPKAPVAVTCLVEKQ